MADTPKKEITNKDRLELLGSGMAKKAGTELNNRQRTIEQIIQEATEGVPPPEPDKVKRNKGYKRAEEKKER